MRQNKTVGSSSSGSISSDEASTRKLLTEIYKAESGRHKNQVDDVLLFGPSRA